MRATLNIPDDLIEEVQNMAGVKSKTQAIVIALLEYTKKKRLERLLQLKGNINIDYDWAKEEEIELSNFVRDNARHKKYQRKRCIYRSNQSS
jgi:hypothetical protein